MVQKTECWVCDKCYTHYQDEWQAENCDCQSIDRITKEAENSVMRNFEEEYHKNMNQLLELKLQVEDMIENIIIKGLNYDTRKQMIQTLKKCK